MLLQEKREKEKNFVSAVMEQNQLLQDRVVALETMIKDKVLVDVSDVATVQRMDDVERKLDALRDSVEQIKSALASWAR
jgi:hypothetical protein